MSDNIQALADELAKLNKNNTLWAQPHINQSGAASMLAQNQVQVQAYANAMPGAYSPALSGGDPRAANYMIQQQYALNPYQARFYGGDYNNMMAGAEYQTSSRMGIYRQQQQTAGPNLAVPGSVIGDLFTLSGNRGFGGYENPYESYIAASRRMTGRAEMGIASGIEIASAIPGMFAGGMAGLGLGLALPMAASFATDQYMSRRRETGQIHNVMRDLVSGTSATGFGGVGVNMRSASEMMQNLRTTAANDPYKSMEDYMSTLQMGSASGLFNFESSPEAVLGKAKKALGMVNVIMQLAGDTDLQSTIQRMANFQAMGVSMGNMEAMSSNIKAFSKLAGASFEDVMSGGGAFGAQQAQQLGGSAAFGLRVGGMAQGMANRMLQSGAVDPVTATMLGGKSGIMQSASSYLVNDVHSILTQTAAGYMNADGTVDQDRLNSLISGKSNLISESISGINRIGGSKFLGNYEKAVANAQANLTPIQSLQISKNRITDMARMGGISSDDIYNSMGAQGDVMRYMHSDSNMADILHSSAVTQQEVTTKRRSEQELANTWFMRAGRSVSESIDGMFRSSLYDNVAEWSDRRAAKAAGVTYDRGLSGSYSDAFLKRYASSREAGAMSLDFENSASLQKLVAANSDSWADKMNVRWNNSEGKNLLRAIASSEGDDYSGMLQRYSNLSGKVAKDFDYNAVTGKAGRIEQLQKLAEKLAPNGGVSPIAMSGVADQDIIDILGLMSKGHSGFEDAKEGFNLVSTAASQAIVDGKYAATSHLDPAYKQYKSDAPKILQDNLIAAIGGGDISMLLGDISPEVMKGMSSEQVSAIANIRADKDAIGYLKGNTDLVGSAVHRMADLASGNPFKSLESLYSMPVSPYSTFEEYKAQALNDPEVKKIMNNQKGSKEEISARLDSTLKQNMIEAGASEPGIMLASINQQMQELVAVVKEKRSFLF